MPQAVDGKPKRIKNILDYLQQDVPKVGGNTESVPGQDMSKPKAPGDNVNVETTDAIPISENDDKVKKKANPKFFS